MRALPVSRMLKEAALFVRGLSSSSGSHALLLFAAARHVVDEGPVDVGATETDGIEEGIGISYKVLLIC